MARTMTTMALAQAIVGASALIGGLGRPYGGPAQNVGLTAMLGRVRDLASHSTLHVSSAFSAK